MSHAGCRGYIGRQEHPETQSDTRTYGTKKSSYVHAYIEETENGGKGCKRKAKIRKTQTTAREAGKKYLTIENGRGGPVATP